MPKNKPIKIIGLSHKIYKKNGGRFGAIQVLFSNGCNSPVLLSENENAEGLTKTDIDFSKIKTIKGTE